MAAFYAWGHVRCAARGVSKEQKLRIWIQSFSISFLKHGLETLVTTQSPAMPHRTSSGPPTLNSFQFRPRPSTGPTLLKRQAWEMFRNRSGNFRSCSGNLKNGSGNFRKSFWRKKKRLKSLKISRAAAPMTVTRGCPGPACHMLVLRAARVCCVRLSGPRTWTLANWPHIFLQHVIKTIFHTPELGQPGLWGN